MNDNKVPLVGDITDDRWLEKLPDLPLPDGLMVMIVDRMARRYGWPPSEILALPVTLALALLMLDKAPTNGLESAGIVISSEI